MLGNLVGFVRECGPFALGFVAAFSILRSARSPLPALAIGIFWSIAVGEAKNSIGEALAAVCFDSAVAWLGIRVGQAFASRRGRTAATPK
jgi:hypothetical protein